MLTINVEKEPTKVSSRSSTYIKHSKEYTLKHNATINGEEESITTLLWVSANDLYLVVELEHQHELLETHMNGTVSQWLIDIGALGETPAEALEKVGRVYLFTEGAYNKLVNHLEIMCEQNKENNRHDHQH